MAKKPLKKKFFNVELPLIETEYEVYAYTIDELNGKSIKIDMTRKLKGKAVDLVFEVKVNEDKAIAQPKRLRLMPFFITHMLRKNISYVEDSIKSETKESNILIKPFLITRKPVSRAVRSTLRNSARNWIEDYTKTKTNIELFEDILSGQLQKTLSIKLKKIYPLSLCEIRTLELKKLLEAKQTPEKKEEVKTEEKKSKKTEKTSDKTKTASASKDAPSKEGKKKE